MHFLNIILHLNMCIPVKLKDWLHLVASIIQ